MPTIRNLAATATIVVFSLTGCSADVITGPLDRTLPAPGLSGSATVERPWTGECDVAAQFTGPTTLTIIGTCQLAHLGRTSVIEYQTIEPGPTGIAYTNTATYMAANGDELRTTGVGVATPTATGLSLSGIETAAGGTGRFENASGTATLTGAVRFTGPASTIGAYSLDGRLSY